MRKEKQRQVRKKSKVNKRRIIFSGILASVLVIAAITGVFLWKKKAPEQPILQQERQYTTFQKAVNAEFEKAKASFVGEETEVDLVAKTFATNFFTLWGVQNNTDYNGKEFIAEEFQSDFDKNVQNNLLFRFSALEKEYKRDNLPIVTNVTHDEVTATDVVLGEAAYTGYSTRLFMEYQNGQAEGTKNVTQAKADDFLKKWVNSAQITFYFIPDEMGTGSWKIASMKHMLSNEDKDRDINEYIYQGEQVSTPGPPAPDEPTLPTDTPTVEPEEPAREEPVEEPEEPVEEPKEPEAPVEEPVEEPEEPEDPEVPSTDDEAA